MIKNIFIPEHIGNQYLFSKRVIGIDLSRVQVNVTSLYLTGKKIIVEQTLAIPLEASAANGYEERAIAALRSAQAQIKHADEIHTSLPSSLVIFKELHLPFIGRDKIALVVEFEVEPLLPFSINDAVIDFIITHENTKEQTSTILVAAAQKMHIAQHLALFESAGIRSDVVTVDLFALYGLYCQIPTYRQTQGNDVLIILGSQTTRLAYIQAGQLRIIRSLGKGFASVAKTMSENLQVPATQTLESLLRFGLERQNDPTITHATTVALTSLFNEITFTFASLTGSDQYAIDRIILVGSGAEIKGLPDFVHSLTGITTERMQLSELIQTGIITLKQNHAVPLASMTSFAAAFPAPITEQFNLRKKEFQLTTDVSLVNKQLLAGLVLMIVIIGSLLTYTFIQLNRLKSAAAGYEQEVIETLKEKFPKDLADVTDIEDAVDSAQRAVNQAEKVWFSIANPARVPFLNYLLELTRLIDKKSLGFVIDKLIITDTMITMTAHVRDHAALALLEKELRSSPLFAQVERQQNIDFTMKIKLAKNR